MHHRHGRTDDSRRTSALSLGRSQVEIDWTAFSRWKISNMNHMLGTTTLASLVLFGVIGCSETKKSTTKQETTITTPSGKTTITTEKEIKQTGDNPPKTTP
jgi:hypothetical protein